ncbi:MAG: FAD-dependent oxidoreductase, partial [Candidatus Binatia bacterium]
ESGQEVVVIEQKERVGGLCQTVEHEGFRFDLGGHRFISRHRKLIERVKGLLDDELLVAQRRSVIHWRGREYHYPLVLDDLLRKVPWGLGLRCLGDLLQEGLRRNGKSKSVSLRKGGFAGESSSEWGRHPSLEDWLIGRFGPTLSRTFFEPYTLKLWGLPPRELSADWAGQRIASLSLGEALARLLRLKKGHLRTYASTYYYPKKGIGQIFEKIAEAVETSGGTIYLNATLKEIVLQKDRAQAVRFLQNGKAREVACETVISTIPLPDTVRALSLPLLGLEEALEGLRFRSLRFLNLLIEGEDISSNTWIYVPDAGVPVTRIQEPKKRSPFNSPPGKTSLILEIPCSPGDRTWEEEERTLCGEGIKALKALGIEIEGMIKGFFTTRAEHAYPVYTLDYQKHRSRLMEALEQYENLLPCGRQGLFRYLFMDQAMEMGLLASYWARGEASREDVLGLGLEGSLVEAETLCP